jgi:O-antigen/teichoic acid export membrane protein
MFKNIGSNWLLMLATMASAYFLLPFTLRCLGNDQYGTWLLITSFTGYLGLLVLGVPMASVRYITHDASIGDYPAMNKTIATCAGMYLLIGAASLVIGVGLLVVFEWAYDVPVAFRNTARIAYLIVVSTTSVSFFAQMPHGIMASYHDFVGRNMVQTGSILVKVLFTVVLLTWKPSLMVLAFVLLVPVILESGIMWMLVSRKYPEVKLNLSLFDWKTMRQIFSFSVFVLVLNIGIQLSFQTDSLVIGKLLNINQIPYYAVANTIMVYAMQFVIGIAAVVMPMATRLQAQGHQDQLKRLFFKWSKITFSLTLLGGLFLLVFGPELIRAWIGSSFATPAGIVLQVLMLSALVFLPIRGVALPILMGIGRPRSATVAFLLAGVLNLILSVVLARPLGLLGVAVGTAIPNVFFGLVLLIICAKELNFRIREYLSRVVLLPLAGAVPVAAALVWCDRGLHLRGFPGLSLAFLISAAVFITVWCGFVYRGDRDVNVGQLMQGLRQRVLS